MGCNTSKLDSTSFEAVAESEEEQQSKAYVQHKYGSKGSRNIKGDVCFGLQSSHEMIRLLGKGGTGETWLCRNKQTDQLEAVKLIKRPIPKLLLPMIFQEIKIQADLGDGHLNIISSHEVILTPSHLALCMEYASGGSLTSYVSDRWNSTPERGGLFLSEDEARYFFIQFVLAVEYCHSHNVAHRDLKLDNTLLDNSNPPRLKICDFGFAKAWGDASQNLFTQIGTPVYMSPQQINSRNGNRGYSGSKSDVWAIGVLLFVMLLGMFPFEHTNHPNPDRSAAYLEVWLQQIKSSWRENPRVSRYAARLSPECRDLLDKIFQLDESKRLTIAQIKEHPWYTKPLPPLLKMALDELKTAQRKVNRLVDSGVYQNSERDDKLKQLIKEAAHLPLDKSGQAASLNLLKITSNNQQQMDQLLENLPLSQTVDTEQ
eukprot:TRINITY_DN7162_c0_g1_i1.p1 TRINITY_DN7162_c0_g1~~TRINITY_DN7162_c0_g1_i1.p1  ORF type:complete len:429 (-),score=26.56 TRINITY_DN7162_c0_g1_i1:444-1730(-)